MDLEGWQDTRWGMTERELVAAINSAELLHIHREDYLSHYADYSLPNLDVAGFYFDVTFQMDKNSNRLSQVLIKHDADPHTKPTKAFSSALKLLTEKLGKPERAGTSDEFVWKFPTTTVCLSVYFSEEILSFVSVIYCPTASYQPKDKRSAF